VDAFIAVATQWNTTALASGKVHWHGLNYAGARAGLKQAKIRLTPDQWSGVQVMERAAAAALNGVRA
tara:strand:+ start:565 stop:765 length:201 start_codon:yes stop_codon:yes gene_type:complete